MQRLFPLFLAACLLAATSVPVLAVQASEAPAARPLPLGKGFPDVALAGKLSTTQAAYLGLTSEKLPAPIGAIQAEALIVEVFSMYCPFCQKEAPTVNALYDLIEKRGLSGRVKIIGIGAGNSDTEVEIYRKKFETLFPLFSDPDFAVHKLVGAVGTPYYYLLAKTSDGSFKILEGSLGCMTSPEQFLSEVLQKAGL
jgi:peroxiredoxin